MGREKNYNNPYGSIPFPDGKEIPHTFWSTQGGMPIAWVEESVSLHTAVWQSPIFDMRAYLLSSQTMKRSGVPIWDTSAKLYVQIFNLTALNVTDSLRLEYREYANTTYGEVTQAGPPAAVPSSGNPNQTARDPVVRVMPRTDITSEVMLGVDQPDSVVLVFDPLGESYPVRYWRLELLWSYLAAGPPSITIQAAMY